MHAPGLDDFVEKMTQRLANEGFMAIAPQLYHRQDLASHETGLERMSQLTDAEVISDINACVSHLQSRTDVAAGLGIMGFCMGGRIAFLMAAANAAFKAAVPFYGGNTESAWGEGPSVLDRLGDVSCPLLAFFGGQDNNPSPTRLGKDHEFREYPKAGHGYMNFNNPERYNKEASEASWPLALSFLIKHLKVQI